MIQANRRSPIRSYSAETRHLLARFGLSGPIVQQPVKELSGGERSRAALARLVVEGANVLADQPTNHLDIWACDAPKKR